MKNSSHTNLEVASALGAVLVLLLGVSTAIAIRSESPPLALPWPPSSVVVTDDALVGSAHEGLVRVGAAPSTADGARIPQATKTRVHRLARLAAGQPVDPPATAEEQRTADQLRRLRTGSPPAR